MDHAIPPTDKWVGGKIISNHYANDWEAGRRKKAYWPGHLAEIVHAYNANQSIMMGYCPHYLMFGCRPRFPVNFYFPTFRSTEVPKRGASTKCVNKYMATVCN